MNAYVLTQERIALNVFIVNFHIIEHANLICCFWIDVAVHKSGFTCSAHKLAETSTMWRNMKLFTRMFCTAAIFHSLQCRKQVSLYPSLNDGPTSPVKKLVGELMTTTLAGEDIFFVIDPGLQRNFDNLFQTERSLLRSFTSMSWDSVIAIRNEIPITFIQGENVIICVIYYNSPEDFFVYEEILIDWNPGNLLLIYLNSNGRTMPVFKNNIVKRSMHIVVINYVVDDLFLVKKILHQRPGVNETHRVVNLGYYEPGKFGNKTSLFRRDNSQLNGSKIYLASWCDDFPFILQNKNHCVGVSIDLLAMIGTIYNFTFDVQEKPADGHWGSLVNGTWNGMLGQLMHNGKHMIINNFLLTTDKFHGFDSTYPYFSEGFGFAVKNPQQLPRWLALVHPFTLSVWVWLICVTSVVVIATTIALYFVPDPQPYQSIYLVVST